MEIRITVPDLNILEQISFKFHANTGDEKIPTVFVGGICMNKWWDMLAEIKKRTTAITYEAWFSKLKPCLIDYERKVLVAETDDMFVKRVVEEKYGKLIQEIAENVIGEGFRVEIKLNESEKNVPGKDSGRFDV